MKHGFTTGEKLVALLSVTILILLAGFGSKLVAVTIVNEVLR